MSQIGPDHTSLKQREIPEGLKGQLCFLISRETRALLFCRKDMLCERFLDYLGCYRRLH